MMDILSQKVDRADSREVLLAEPVCSLGSRAKMYVHHHSHPYATPIFLYRNHYPATWVTNEISQRAECKFIHTAPPSAPHVDEFIENLNEKVLYLWLLFKGALCVTVSKLKHGLRPVSLLKY